jgi:hypothetical protein
MINGRIFIGIQQCPEHKHKTKKNCRIFLFPSIIYKIFSVHCVEGNFDADPDPFHFFLLVDPI